MLGTWSKTTFLNAQYISSGVAYLRPQPSCYVQVQMAANAADTAPRCISSAMRYGSAFLRTPTLQMAGTSCGSSACAPYVTWAAWPSRLDTPSTILSSVRKSRVTSWSDGDRAHPYILSWNSPLLRKSANSTRGVCEPRQVRMDPASLLTRVHARRNEQLLAAERFGRPVPLTTEVLYSPNLGRR